MKKILFFYSFILFSFLMNAQNSSAHICNYTGSDGDITCDPLLIEKKEPGPFFLNISVYVVNQLDGSGGLTDEEVEQAIENLSVFNAHNIFFVWDCNIISLNDNELFQKKTLNAVLEETNGGSSDSLNLYFYPALESGGGGLGQSIPGTALMLYGYQLIPEPVPSALLSTFPHEMGHILGLLHPDNDNISNPSTQNEEEDGSNWFEAGDCIQDTPPSDGISVVNIDVSTCTYNNTDPDFNPDITNIMASSLAVCRTKFSPGQGQRMRNMIAIDHNSIFLSRLAQERVQTNTTWTLAEYPEGKNISGNVEVLNGATLTIEAGVEVRFSNDAVLRIRPNARVNLHGTLTNKPCPITPDCGQLCGDTWKGIEVWGDRTEPQYVVNGEYAQGRLYTYTGASIENARIAIQAWGPTRPNNGGGIVHCNETTFLNNQIGIDYAPYQSSNMSSVGYVSSINNCDFQFNDDSPYAKFNAHIKMLGTNGVIIRGGSFTNEQTFSPNTASILNYGYGILAIDAGFDVLPSCSNVLCLDLQPTIFTGLGVAIYAGNRLSIDKTFSVQQAEFYNNYVGIHNRGMDEATILFNRFSMGLVADPAVGDGFQTGIAFSNAIDGLTIEDNQFMTVATPLAELRTVGISMDNLESNNNVIRHNTIEGLTIGNQATRLNAGEFDGLVYECNTNNNNQENDFLVFDADEDDTTIDNIRLEQGVLGIADYAATVNTFSFSENINFNNEGNSGFEIINYYYNQIEELPLSSTGINPSFTPASNSCENNNCPIPCPIIADDGGGTIGLLPDLKETYYTTRTDLEQSVENYALAVDQLDATTVATAKLEVITQRTTLDETASRIVRILLKDSINYNRDSLRTWIGNKGNYTTALDIAKSYFAEGNIGQVQNLTQAVYYDFDLDEGQINDWYNTKAIFQLITDYPTLEFPASEQTALVEIANSNTPYASGIAKNILTNEKRYFPPTQKRGRGKDIRERESDNTISEAIDLINIYPNPASEQVNFQATTLNSKVQVHVYDLLGRLIWSSSIDSNKTTTWQTQGISGGIYFYKVAIDNTILQSGTVLVQH